MRSRTGFRCQAPGVRRQESEERSRHSLAGQHHRHSREGGNPVCLAGALLTILLTAQAAPAQVATGFPPYGTFTGTTFDTINNANLNVHFEIPILNKAGRGLPFTYALRYDSSIWWASGGYWTPSTSFWGWGGNG